MANFFNIIKSKCIENKRGKTYYILSLSIVFLLCISCLIIFLISTISPNLFFTDRDSYDTLIEDLESKYTPNQIVLFGDSWRKYYLVYNRANDNLRININIKSEDHGTYSEDKIEYIFKNGKIKIYYTSFEDNKEIFSTEFIKKDSEFEVLDKYKKYLDEPQIEDAIKYIRNSFYYLKEVDISTMHSAISEYTIFQNNLNTVFAVSLTFFIIFFLVAIAMLILFFVAYKRPYVEDAKTITILTDETVAILKKYKELLDNKIITEEEFEIIKSKHLNL